MIHPGLAGAYGLATIVVWIFGLAALLVWLEKRPPQRQVAESVKIDMGQPVRSRGRALRTAHGSAGRPLAALLRPQ